MVGQGPQSPRLSSIVERRPVRATRTSGPAGLLAPEVERVEPIGWGAGGTRDLQRGPRLSLDGFDPPPVRSALRRVLLHRGRVEPVAPGKLVGQSTPGHSAGGTHGGRSMQNRARLTAGVPPRDREPLFCGVPLGLSLSPEAGRRLTLIGTQRPSLKRSGA